MIFGGRSTRRRDERDQIRALREQRFAIRAGERMAWLIGCGVGWAIAFACLSSPASSGQSDQDAALATTEGTPSLPTGDGGGECCPCAGTSVREVVAWDEPDPLGPFEVDCAAYPPAEPGLYSLRELAQNYATLYYTQYRILRALGWAAPTCQPPPPPQPADVNRDGRVLFDDITAVLAAWGWVCECAGAEGVE